MKRLYGFTAALAVGLGLSQASWAIAITENPHIGVDVGAVDSLIGTAQLANSGNAENKWLKDWFPSAEILPQEQSVVYYDTNVLGVYAFLLNPIADYFMIKNSTWHALFENNEENGWGVFDTSKLPTGMNLGGERFTISHIRVINDPNTPPPTSVPEPTTLTLLGLGLLALGFARRRKQA